MIAKESGTFVDNFNDTKEPGDILKIMPSAVNTELCCNWLASIWPSLQAGYRDNDIDNADEPGIFINLTSDKILFFRNDKSSKKNNNFNQQFLLKHFCMLFTTNIRFNWL